MADEASLSYVWSPNGARRIRADFDLESRRKQERRREGKNAKERSQKKERGGSDNLQLCHSMDKYQGAHNHEVVQELIGGVTVATFLEQKFHVYFSSVAFLTSNERVKPQHDACFG